MKTVYLQSDNRDFMKRYFSNYGPWSLLFLVLLPWGALAAEEAEGVTSQMYDSIVPRYPIVAGEQHLLPILSQLNNKLDGYGLAIDSMLLQDVGYIKYQQPVTGAYAYTFYGLQGRLDCEKLMNWHGAEFLVAMLAGAQYTASEETALIAENDYIAGLSGVQLAELWWRQRFWGDRAAVQLGKVDCLGSFAIIPAAENYINFKFFAPAGIFWFCPTFPYQALGAIASLSAESFRVRSGIYDGAQAFAFAEPLDQQPDPQPGNGLFYASEAELRWSLKDHFGYLSVGGWLHSGKIPAWSGCPNSGAYGWYLIGQQQLMANPLAGPQSDGLWLWGSLGYSGPARVTPFSWDAAIGMSWIGTLLYGKQDLFGIGVSYLQAPCNVQPATLNRHEITTEIYAGFEILPGVTLQPDLQFIHNPLFVEQPGWATVATIRMTILF